MSDESPLAIVPALIGSIPCSHLNARGSTLAGRCLAHSNDAASCAPGSNAASAPDFSLPPCGGGSGWGVDAAPPAPFAPASLPP